MKCKKVDYGPCQFALKADNTLGPCIRCEEEPPRRAAYPRCDCGRLAEYGRFCRLCAKHEM